MLPRDNVRHHIVQSISFLRQLREEELGETSNLINTVNNAASHVRDLTLYLIHILDNTDQWWCWLPWSYHWGWGVWGRWECWIWHWRSHHAVLRTSWGSMAPLCWETWDCDWLTTDNTELSHLNDMSPRAMMRLALITGSTDLSRTVNN